MMKFLQEEEFETWDEPGCSVGLHCPRLSNVPQAASPSQFHWWNCCRKKDMNLTVVLICIVVAFLTCHMPHPLLNLIVGTFTGRRIWTVRWTWLQCWSAFWLSFSHATCMPCRLLNLINETVAGRRIWIWLQCWSALSSPFSRATCRIPFSISSMEHLQEEGYEPWDEPGCSAGLHCGCLSHVPHAASSNQPHRWNWYRKKNMTCEMNLAAVLVWIVVVFLMCYMPCLLLNLIDKTVTGRRMWTVRWTWLQCWSASSSSFSRATCCVSFSISSMKLLQEEGYEPWDEPGCSSGLRCHRLSHLPHAASPSQFHWWNCCKKKDMNLLQCWSALSSSS